ncbi:tRNA (adenosine(37)-N6)-threonylcarbamoyltransferase complex ATPase subunit type 1 TsaE [Albimonas sp. CAU 1670]|uniref:tRNA (adenosine(37)-N6)-threonylcarbamoyltransferase complex ATPase subunit type 1 TsaE n=1 Tax=Albimonas sp. CAU 1670 TaxID=3032599 RepID=UPI0023DC5D1C|nr:tRNA (adenosine(37)-N6)-threonylcarbamoyltransferase complex ATPase subunit type 1 TsaE [Albimonas sp. CAU 1670]MDF2232494.1 tRNA (adenosine(37)-N6)-threonylcarbamoyltransferase complex ATPase subunit type 1 TsaE [Albimonas sp. CAU 1670]
MSAPSLAAAAPPDLRLSLPDAEATDRLGAALGLALAPGDAVMLSGDLGAGKSALARAAIAAILAQEGRVEDIPSPSFTLVQTYDSERGEIWHADLHRLGGPAAIPELGLEEAFDDAICLVEWPDRLGPLAPGRRLEIALAFPPGGEEGRVLDVRALGPGWEAALAALGA